MSNSQEHCSTQQQQPGKLLLAIYASFNPLTSTYTFEISDLFDQLLVSDFGRAPRRIVGNDSAGVAFALACAYHVASARFSNYQVIRCLTELRGAEVNKCQAA